MSEPLVSVVLPVYNRESTIERAIRSVLEQSHANIELLVVDDGSSDASVARIKAFSDPRMRLILMPANGGAAAARNRGIRESRGEWVAFQDSDDEWLPEKLQLQLACADGADVVLCAYRTKVHGEHKQIRPEALLAGGEAMPDVLDGWPIITPTWLVRRSILPAGEAFDTRFRCLEDWDLILRLAQTHRITAAGPEPGLVKYSSPDAVCAVNEHLCAALDEILRRHRQCWVGEPRRLARRLTHLACLRYRQGKRHLARRLLWDAIRQEPSQWPPWALLISSLRRGSYFSRAEQRWPHYSSMAL